MCLSITDVEVDDVFIIAVKKWLLEKIPDFAEFVITSAGRYSDGF